MSTAASAESTGATTVAFRWTSFHTGALVILCLAQLIESLDVTVVNVALPAIKRDVGFSESTLPWVANAYAVMFGGFLLLGGRSGDLLGKRRIFVGGVALFAIASLVTGLANNAGLLTAGRAFQGLSAAFVSPMSLAMIASIFPQGPARNRAFGIWGTTSGISTSVGVIMGGLLTDGPGWRWIFLINLPIAAILLLGAAKLLPRDGTTRDLRGFDVVGAVLITAGVSTVVYACAQTQDHPWGSARTLTLLAVAAVLVAGFIVYETKVATNPLVSFELFRSRSVAVANVVAVFVGGALLAMFYCLSLYQQQVLHYSALKTGLSYLPLTAVMTACAFLAPALIPRIGIRAVIFLGSVTATGGLMLFATMSPDGGLWANVILPSLVVGPGLALTFIPMSMAAITGVQPAQMGVASAMANVTRTLGGALGLAIIATLAATASQDQLASGGSPSSSLADGFSLGFTVAAAMMAVAALASLLLPRMTANESA